MPVVTLALPYDIFISAVMPEVYPQSAFRAEKTTANRQQKRPNPLR
ncbi:Uncharacterized protein BN1183_AO_00350 [Pantoea ananatis]|nr:Uncharacterized protein BN1183_AO_00350 [Pantoea ananatis]